MYVIKKDGTKEEFNVDKIIAAVNKSASRIMYRFTENEIAFICEYAKEKAKERSKDGITIPGDAQHCGGSPGTRSIPLWPRATAITGTTSRTLST